ncbi:hypothetical protein D3C75_635150 [compost metagenome]
MRADTHFFEQLCEDVLDVVVLKTAAVLTLGAAPELRAYRHAVERLMFAAVALLAEGDDTAHPALDHIALPDGEQREFVENGFKANRRVITGDGDLQAEQRRKGLFKLKVHHRKGVRRCTPGGEGKAGAV